MLQPHAESSWSQPVAVGADGVAMMALSAILVLLSLGMTLLCSFCYVLWVAWRTPSNDPGNGRACQRILVLGMRLDAAGRPTAAYQMRLARAITLGLRAPTARIVLLGGQTRPGAESEAEAGATELRARGIPAERIQVEDRSRHTLENLLHYRARFAGNAGDRPLLVTSRFHLARSSLLAAGLNIPHIPCAAEDRRLPPVRHVPRMVFESLLVHWYVTARVFARLTGNRWVLARIT